MPGENRRRRDAEACPPGAGEQSAECGEESPVSWLIGGTSNLASEHGDLVAQGQQLDVVGALRADHQGNKLQ
jgi:hypothetical protein